MYKSEIFEQPCIPPSKYNLLPLIWTHVTKPDSAKKARFTCNGSLYQKGTVALGNAHAASLEKSGARFFWALESLTACQVHGADATNAFTEALPHVDPLCVTIDEQHRNWNNIHKSSRKYQRDMCYLFSKPYKATLNLHVSGLNISIKF